MTDSRIEISDGLDQLFHQLMSIQAVEERLQQMGFSLTYQWLPTLQTWEAEVWHYKDPSFCAASHHDNKETALALAVIKMVQSNEEKAAWEKMLQSADASKNEEEK